MLATLLGEVVLVDLRKGGGKWKLNHDLEEELDDMEVDQADDKPVKKGSTLTSAVWSPCGSRIYTGTNQGEIIIFDPLTRQVSYLDPETSRRLADYKGNPPTQDCKRYRQADCIRFPRTVSCRVCGVSSKADVPETWSSHHRIERSELSKYLPSPVS